MQVLQRVCKQFESPVVRVRDCPFLPNLDVGSDSLVKSRARQRRRAPSGGFVGSPRASCLEPGAAGCQPHRGLQALAQPRPPGVAAECPGQCHRLRSHPTAPSGRSPDECAKTPSDGSPPVTPSCQAVPAKALEKVRPGRAGHSVVCERGRVAAAATVCSGSRRSPRESVQGSGRWPQDAARHGTSGWACVLLPLEGRTTLWSRGWPCELSMSG